MEDRYRIPSINPSSIQTDAGMLREIFRLHDIDFGTVKPARVIEYDRNTHKASVQILINDVYETNQGTEYVETQPIKGIPVWRWQGGGYIVDTPLYPGETGLLFAGHRDSTLAIQHNGAHTQKPKRDKDGKFLKAVTGNTGPQPPNTYLLHRYENGFFLPFRFGTINLPTDDANALVIGRMKEDGSGIESVIKLKENGGVYIQTSVGGGFKVVAYDNVNIDGMTPQDVTYLSDVSYNASTHKFTKTVNTMKAIILEKGKKEVTVFEAAPHKPCEHVG